MPAIHTLIVDDERLSRQRIRKLLEGEADVEVLGECSNGPEAVARMAEKQPDLLFLDIQMPGLDGFNVMDTAVAKAVPLVVFVSAFDGYALKAFDVHAFDYLLKPFDRPRFQETMQRARAQLVRMRTGEPVERRGLCRLAVRSPGHMTIVRTEEIDWIEAADNYVCLHCAGRTHILRETMNTIETRLSPAQFQRVHRSTIVNVDRIRELQPWFRGDWHIVLRDGTKLTLSRTYREKLEAVLLSEPA